MPPLRQITSRAAESTTPIALIVVAATLSILSANPGLTAASLVCLWALVRLTWRRGEPPILLFAVGLQWLSVATKVFHADLRGEPVAALAQSSSITTAIWISLGALVVLALGMRLGAWGIRQAKPLVARGDVEGLSIRRLWWAYFAAFVWALFAGRMAWAIPGLTQGILVLASVKWFFFFLLAYVVFKRSAGYRVVGVAVILEVVTGFTGYFSLFKQAFFVLGIAYLTARPKLNRRTALQFGAIVAVTIALSLIWMGVRREYRDLVNLGSGQQTVELGFAERSSAMLDMVTSLGPSDLPDTIERLLERVAYVDYFGHVIDNVPRYIPHEQGRLWWAAIRHVLTPRLLFPDKPRLPSDSELTKRYTGLWVASSRQGTSVSMGYVAESYIDFGYLLLFVPIFVLGLLWGGMYRYFLAAPGPTGFGFAAAVTVIMKASLFETHNVKLLGGMLTSFLVMALWLRFVMPRLPLSRRPAGEGRLSRRAVGRSSTARTGGRSH